MSKKALEDIGSTSNPAYTRKPDVAGILDMVSGIGLGLVSLGGCMNVINGGRTQDAWMLALIIPGVLALVGGIYARQRTNWVLAFIGSICAIPVFLGVISTVLVFITKKEFKKTDK
jgi:hypothetical protein